MIHKIKKTIEIIKEKWVKSALKSIYYYLTIRTKNVRKKLIYKHIHWCGVEIWWFDNPAPIKTKTTSVKYVDYLDEENLIKTYPHLKNKEIQKLDYVCKADNLDKIEPNSQDFIIANHLFEHLQNPIKALSERYRVTKDWWSIFMTIPDKRKTSDEKRERTTLEHIISDYISPSEERDRDHYMDYAWIHISDHYQIEKEAQRLKITDNSIHYHVFIEEDVLSIIERCNKNTDNNFAIKYIKHTTKSPADNEFIIILQVSK